MQTRAQKKADTLKKAERVWAGLSQLRRALDEGDPLGEIRVRVNDLVGEIGSLVDALKAQ